MSTPPIGSNVNSTIRENDFRKPVTEQHAFGIAGIKTTIFSYLNRGNGDLEFAHMAQVCKNWRQSVSDQHIATLQLETITTLTYDEILNWQLIFEKRYNEALSLTALIKKCPNLTKLDFSNSQMDNAAFKEMLKQIAGTGIEELDLSGNTLEIDEFWPLPKLKILKMRNCNLQMNASFENFPNLEELDFSDSTIRRLYLSALKNVRRFSFNNSKGIKIFDFENDSIHLEEISFSGSKIESLYLKNSSFLKFLKLDNCLSKKSFCKRML
jgi:Leucine-rich repeat (LRR) protein